MGSGVRCSWGTGEARMWLGMGEWGMGEEWLLTLGGSAEEPGEPRGSPLPLLSAPPPPAPRRSTGAFQSSRRRSARALTTWRPNEPVSKPSIPLSTMDRRELSLRRGGAVSMQGWVRGSRRVRTRRGVSLRTLTFRELARGLYAKECDSLFEAMT